MKQKLTLTTLVALAGLAGGASFGQTTFVFEDSNSTIGAALDNQASGSFTVDGIEITATASVDDFNVTSSGFGINQSTGTNSDDTDAFDFTETSGTGVAEGFTLSFDQAVELVSFSVGSWNAGTDEVTLADSTTNIATITTGGSTSLGNYLLGSGSEITVSTTGGDYGNGWHFDSITIVPEPSAFSLIAGMLALTWIMLRRRG